MQEVSSLRPTIASIYVEFFSTLLKVRAGCADDGRESGRVATRNLLRKGSRMNDAPLPANLLIVGDNKELFAGVLDVVPTICPYWDIRFASDAASAEGMLGDDDDTIDAVVVQARLSDADGLRFLESVRRTHPRLARLLVVSQLSSGRPKNLGQVAHEVIAHPFNAIHFVSVVEAVIETQRRITDPALQRLLSDIDVLPTPPKSVLELNQALQQPEAEIPAIAAIVDENVAVTAKLLRVVNSSYFGLQTPIAETAHAVAYLGLDTVRNLVGGLELLNALQPGDPDVVTEVENLQAHSLVVAGVAQGFMKTRQASQDAYIAGMLHDVGLLALVSCAPTHYLALREEALHSGRTLAECEFDVVGATHTAIGAYVLGLWGFPSWLVEAVSCSHDAEALPEWALDATSAVFVAEQTVNANPETATWEGSLALAPEYLDALGLSSAFAEVEPA
jgi:HD-like signal output (HDOD) protein